MRQGYEIDGVAVECQVMRRGAEASVKIGVEMGEASPSTASPGASLDLAKLHELGSGEYRLVTGATSHRLWIAREGDAVFVHWQGRAWRIDPSRNGGGGGKERSGGGGDTARAPMPGKVISVRVKPGEAVHTGQTLVVIESMKLETPIIAWRDGEVAQVHHEEGASFDRNAPLVTLAPETKPI